MTSNQPMRGFSVIEIVLVVALIAVLASVSVVGSVRSYEQAVGRTGLEKTESLLRSARTNAQTGVCFLQPCTQSHHRVWLENGFISIGSQDGSHTERYPLEGTSTSVPTEWLFIAGTGNTASASSALLLSNGGGWQAQLSVNGFGMISSERVAP